MESHLSVLLRLNLVSRRLEDRTYLYEATDVSKKYIDGRSNGNTVEAGAEVEAEAAAAGAPSSLISSAQGSAVSPPAGAGETVNPDAHAGRRRKTRIPAAGPSTSAPS